MQLNAQTSDMARIDAAIDEIRFDFIRRLEDYVERLEDILEASDPGYAPASGIKEAAHICHRISGVAGTFGYAELGHVAQLTETAATALLSCEAGRVDIAAVTDKIRDLADFAADVCVEFSHNGFRARAL